jgi:hypothetical protein
MEIAEFLRACFAEDRAVALAAAPGPWEFDGVSSALTPSGPQGIVVRKYMDGATSVRESVAKTALCGDRVDGKPTAAHIARWDPAHVIAECDAKLRIVDAESRRRRTKDNVIATSRNSFDDWVDVTWADERGWPQEERIRQAEFTERFTEPSPPSETLKLIALPYADRPGYREEWRV